MKKFGLTGYFQKIWYKRYGFSKTRALKRIIETMPFKHSVYIGDRLEDMKAAWENGIEFIGISHGFGKDELSAAEYKAGDLAEAYKTILKIGEEYGKE
ncbi:MAG: HAD hydrolase-like protein [Eubacteriales bacterium]|nr:HAD hydrolase-like protein [Eubacteriales bacterium]